MPISRGVGLWAMGEAGVWNAFWEFIRILGCAGGGTLLRALPLVLQFGSGAAERRAQSGD